MFPGKPITLPGSSGIISCLDQEVIEITNNFLVRPGIKARTSWLGSRFPVRYLVFKFSHFLVHG